MDIAISYESLKKLLRKDNDINEIELIVQKSKPHIEGEEELWNDEISLISFYKDGTWKLK